MGALDNYFGPQPFMGGGMFGGHPVIGAEEELAAALPLAVMAMRRRRTNAGQRCAPQMGWDGQDIMGYGGGTDMGAVEAEEMAAAMEEDDDDDDVDLGASTDRLEDKLDKWKDKRKKRLSKMQSARTNVGRKIWARKVEKADDKIADLKKEIAQRKAQDRAAAGGGRGQDGRGQGGPANDPRYGGGALESPMIRDSQGRYKGIQRAGRIQPLSLYESGFLDAQGQFVGTAVTGLAARSQVAFSFQSNQITYADFFLRGFRIGAYMSAATSTAAYTVQTLPVNLQLRIVVTNLQIAGFPDALYSPVTMELGGTFGLTNNMEIVDGIRANGKLARNNVITLSGYVDNPFLLPPAIILDFTLQAEVLVDTDTDDLYGNYNARGNQ